MNTIAVPQSKLATVVAAAYNLSQPQGMGWLHFTPGDLSTEKANYIVDAAGDRGHIRMDYVEGRAVKLSILRGPDGYYMEDTGRWFDHTAEQWQALKAVVEA